MTSDKIRPHHLARKAILYVRQSSAHQVLHNRESSALQYAMRDRLITLGWSQIETVDDDLGRSAAASVGFERMVAEAEEMAEADKAARGKVDARNKLEGFAYQIKNLIKDEKKSAKLSDDDKETLTGAVDDAISWLDENPDADTEAFDEKYAELEKVAQPIISTIYQGAGAEGGGAPQDEDLESHDEL